MTELRFDFATAQRIIFGSGTLQSLEKILPDYGQRYLVVTGEKYPDPGGLFSLLNCAGVSMVQFIVPHEPDIDLVEKCIAYGRLNKCEAVIGFGGGAVIDTGKAVAALLNNEGNLLDYLEVVGRGLPLQKPSLPYIAVPTTAGTGSEVTRNAVISIPNNRVKVSLRHAFLLPALALIDPQQTMSVPAYITASTGMDAFTQVVEPYVTKITNPVVDMFCRQAIPLAARNLPTAYSNGDDVEARENMSYVSLLGGLSLANAKLGAVHGFAGPIGGMFDAPHGLVCAALLPAVMRVNANILEQSGENRQKVTRFKEIARLVTGNEGAAILDGVNWITNLAHSMEVPGLAQFGITEDDFPGIIEKARRSSSMKGNPVDLSDFDMKPILSMSL